MAVKTQLEIQTLISRNVCSRVGLTIHGSVDAYVTNNIIESILWTIGEDFQDDSPVNNEVDMVVRQIIEDETDAE